MLSINKLVLPGLLLLAHTASGATIYTPYTFTTLAGSAWNSGWVDARGAQAKFHSPHGVAVDQAGYVYVADLANHVIRKITPNGMVSTLAGQAGSPGTNDGVGAAARFNSPWSVAVDNAGNLLVTDTLNHTIRIISPGGNVSTLAGTPGVSGSTDGPASTARFNRPHALTVDNAGNIYLTDHYNHTIRKISPSRMVSTLAGLAGNPGSADGTGIAARFRYPSGIAVDSAGQIFVADEYNHTIRKITANGVVSTFAGSPGAPGSADATGTAARFYNPHGCAVDAVGNIFVSEMNNNTVRRITPAAVVTTLAGLPGSAGSTDGTGNAVRFSGPRGAAVDALGNFYLADFGSNTIRKGWSAEVLPIITAGTPEISDSTASLNCTIWTGSIGGLALLEANQPEGPWATNLSAILTSQVPAVSFRFTLPIGRSVKFFRVRGELPRK